MEDQLLSSTSCFIDYTHYTCTHLSLPTASIFCYVIFLYCKLSKRRRGSYDVNKRRRAGDVESVTSSARSSFRAVSEYHYSPNLESQFLRQILPGSTTSMSEESTTVSVAPATSSESVSGASRTASESSAVSESRPLRSDSWFQDSDSGRTLYNTIYHPFI